MNAAKKTAVRKRPGSRIAHGDRNGVRLDVYIPDDLADALEAACAARGVVRSEGVRLAIAAWCSAAAPMAKSPT